MSQPIQVDVVAVVLVVLVAVVVLDVVVVQLGLKLNTKLGLDHHHTPPPHQNKLF